MYPTNIKPSLLACSIALTLTPAAYAAQELTALEEVVVSATRTEQAVKDVSSSVASVSSQSMESQLATDPQQALKYTPGVEVQGHGRFGISDYNIRGTEGDKIKVMVDGVEQASPYNPGATEQRHYPGTVEVDSLTAIEVNKGPSSTLYGSDALGGAVLFRTKDPSDVLVTDGNENRFGIKSGYTSADETFKNTATWAMRQDDLETLLIVTYADGSETETHGSGADVAGGERGAADPADKKIGNVLGKVYYRLNDNHRIGLVAEYYQRRYDEQELHYDGYSIMMPGSGMPMITYADNYNKDNVSRLRVGVNHEWTMSNVMADSLKWSLNYQQSDSEYKNYDTSTGMMGSGKRMRYRDAGDDLIQFDAQFDKLAEFANSYHQFTYGFTYIHDQFTLDNTDYKYDLGTVTPGSTGVPDATLQKWGLFLQDQAFFLDETLVLTAGVRYDGFRTDPETDEQFDTDYPSNSEDAITGKLGAVYHISNHFSTFAQISQGFKAPSVEDLYYYYNQGAIFNPNPDLKAEKSLAYELGFRGYSDVGRFEISAFYNDYTDFIDGYNTGEQQDGKDVYTTENIANAEIYGIEFSSTVNLDAAFNAPRGLYSKFSVAYAEGRDKDKDVHLDSVAPLTGVVGIGYDSLNRNYGGLVNVTMVASKDDWSDETVEAVSGYTLVDLTAYYRPINDLTLRAGLFNAFDKKYWLYSDMESGYTTASRDFYSQPGRNWGVSLDYQF